MVWTSKMIKYLGAYLDNGLSFKHHISNKCRTAMWNLQCLKPLQPSLTVQAYISLVIGACHGPFGLCQLCIHWSSNVRHQQYAESAKCRCQVCVKPKEDGQQYGRPKMLHWLPIKFRIQFKNLLLVYKCLNGQAPSYLSELLEPWSTISRPGL